MKYKFPTWLKSFVLYVIIPLAITSIAGLFFLNKTKDKVEITCRLNGWISISSAKFGDLTDLRLMLGDQSVDNVLKVSWGVVNTGTKGINNFESGPFVRIPGSPNVVSARVREPSSELRIARDLRIVGNIAYIDSLGIFNTGEYFNTDFYLVGISEESVTDDYFQNWIFGGKALDLSVVQDISYAARPDQEKPLMWGLSAEQILLYLLLILFYLYYIFVLRMRRRYIALIENLESRIAYLQQKLDRIGNSGVKDTKLSGHGKGLRDAVA